jgi:hypothetical protein
MESLQKRFLYVLHKKTNKNLEERVDKLLNMFIAIVKNDPNQDDDDVCLSSANRETGWNYIWCLFYDFYALHHPEMEKVIYKKQQAKIVLPEWSDILNTFHYYSRHNEMNTKVYFSRLLYENVAPISFEKFRKNPSKYNFLCALKTTDPNILYRYIITKKQPAKVARIVISTYEPWIKPRYDQIHILIAAWECFSS